VKKRMTEKEWLSCNYAMNMIRHLGDRAGKRKLDLLAAACFRRIWHLLPGPKSRGVVEVLERHADGEVTTAALTAARLAVWEDASLVDNPEGDKHPSEVAIAAVSMDTILDMLTTAADATGCAHEGATTGPEEKEQCVLAHEIFGNPFRSITFSPSWRTDTAVSLARTMYESREFGALPILADALQDAGCDSAAILDHCRGAGPHVRGCWVMDLILGK